MAKKRIDSNQSDDEREQSRIRAGAIKAVGFMKSGDPHRAERAGEIIRERLRKKAQTLRSPKPL